MDIPLTDLAQVSKKRGASRAFLSADDKLKLELASYGMPPKNELALALRNASTDQLKAALAKQLEALNEIAVLRVGYELTVRGIAPFARGNFAEDEQLQTFWRSVTPLLLLLDLQWIVAKYPSHTPEWLRLKSLFDPRKFGETAKYLHWDGQRSAGQIAKAMGLSEAQQRECAYLQYLAVERWRKRLNKRLPIAQAKIEAAIRASDKRPIADQDETIKRRCDLWVAAELSDWKPQRTAEIYCMMTGKTMSRSLVANQLAKLPKVRRTDKIVSL